MADADSHDAQEPGRESRRSRILVHPLTQTLWQFLLTGVVGGTIAFLLQGVADRHKREAEVRENRWSGAEKVYRDVGTMMDRRFYWGTRYEAALSSGDSIAITTARAKVDTMVTEWNSNQSVNRGLLCVYFGKSESETFARLGPTFNWYFDLRNQSAPDSRTKAERIAFARSQVQNAMFALSLQMADRLRDGRVMVETEGDCTIPSSSSQYLPVLTDSALAAPDVPW